MRPCARRESCSVSGSLEELRLAERALVVDRLLAEVEPRTPWYDDLRMVAGAFVDELEKLQPRPEPGYRVVVEREDGE